MPAYTPSTARLLGHVRDGLDARVGEHRQRQGEDQFFPGRHAAEVHLVDQQGRVQDEHAADSDEQDLRAQVEDRKDEVEPCRLAQAADVQRGQQHHDDQPTDDVAGIVVERVQARERAQVVRHEERRDGDREDVVEAERPTGKERDDVVEGMTRKRGGTAGFGEHGGALGVGFGRQREQTAGEHEHQRSEPERMRGDEAERVVDRGADVAVGGGEEPGNADRAPQSMLCQACHHRGAYTDAPRALGCKIPCTAAPKAGSGRIIPTTRVSGDSRPFL
jgi:hypothetical protein